MKRIYIDIILLIIVIILSIVISRKPKEIPNTTITREYIVQVVDSVMDSRIGCLIEEDDDTLWQTLIKNGAL